MAHMNIAAQALSRYTARNGLRRGSPRQTPTRTPVNPVLRCAQLAGQDATGPAADLIRSVQAMGLPAQVVLLADDDFDDVAVIHSLHATARGQRRGSQTMKAIIEEADRLGVTLMLTPRSAVEHGWGLGETITDGLGQEALEVWYRRKGFEEDQEDGRMWRRPR
jgi:GNAT superfamily N-acetyltransferase